MNKVILIGRFTRDPEIRYTTGSQPTCIARFTLAVDRRFKRDNEPSADFISCVAFGKTGEFIEKYCKQGTKIATVGRIQTGSYTNREGQKVYTTDVIVEECEFAESKNSNNNSNNANASAPTVPPSAPVNEEGFMSLPEGYEDELPFN